MRNYSNSMIVSKAKSNQNKEKKKLWTLKILLITLDSNNGRNFKLNLTIYNL